MKQLIALVLVVVVSTAHAEAVMQKVCHEAVVKGKKVQQCKTIKVHRKVEGTPVPEKKK